MFPKKNSRRSSKFTAVILLVLFHINGGFAADSKVIGKFVYDSDPHDKTVHDVLLELGFEEDDLSTIQRFNPETSLTFALSRDKILMMHKTPDAKQAQQFFNGKEADEAYLLDKPNYLAKTIATLKGDTITFKRKLPKGKKEMVELLECDKEGCKSTMIAGSKTASIKWKRVEHA